MGWTLFEANFQFGYSSLQAHAWLLSCMHKVRITLYNVVIDWCFRVTQGQWGKLDDPDSLDQLDQSAVLVHKVNQVLVDQMVAVDLKVGNCAKKNYCMTCYCNS